MWPSQLSPFLLALTLTTCAGSPLYAAIIPTTGIPTPLNESTLPIPIPTSNTTSSHITWHAPIPVPTTTATTATNKTSSNTTHTHTSISFSGLFPPAITTKSHVPRGDIHSAITTATLYSNGHAYTVTQFSEVNPELSTIGLTTTVVDGTVVTTPATLPVVSGTSGTGEPWRTSVTSTSTAAAASTW
ncbi:uncharacterized protein GGS22DRAFT_130283 [Annulohypoxylon maeteangense]|uniref:uncharacterized protein n=1 Tax=Annulohypoxylon maeteangense TaxID=1927788 RepID=UPI0020081B1A|nr:uncharacterized protein GGS22DRAFT_130283 [Annulohypoxylon maeteangense]KAI0885527.1 hypothetical protein GGS22DRAFT_130283 [Annulohypoxylon maeteangense]